jgi:hypothetical protein
LPDAVSESISPGLLLRLYSEDFLCNDMVDIQNRQLAIAIYIAGVQCSSTLVAIVNRLEILLL